MPSNSQYARRIALLSCRIFSEIEPKKVKPSKKVVEYFSKQPYYKDKKFVKWHPPIQSVSRLMKEVRNLGLFV